ARQEEIHLGSADRAFTLCLAAALRIGDNFGVLHGALGLTLHAVSCIFFAHTIPPVRIRMFTAYTITHSPATEQGPKWAQNEGILANSRSKCPQMRWYVK